MFPTISHRIIWPLALDRPLSRPPPTPGPGTPARSALYPVRISNQVTWEKPDPPPNALHTAFTHAHETLLWASKGHGARHTFNYDLINSPNPATQVSSVWRIPAVPKREKSHGYHPTQKPLRLVRRALLASTREGELVFDPFCGSGTTGVAAKELNRFFVGAELEEEFAELAARRVAATERGDVLREVSEMCWGQ